MYLDFYGFARKPFELTPDPYCVYLGEKHKEALALLKYGVLEHKGFVLLTGEAGTGKTTMVHTLLKYLGGSTRTVYLSNSMLSPKDFLHYVASCLGIKASNGGKGEFIVQFEKFLNECSATQTNIVLIIDEAQDLSFDLLEEIRLLSNMGTGDKKLLNIILVGQPELNTLLSSPQCRPLLQRISIRYHLTPLNPAETEAYVQKRVLAFGGPADLFHKSVVAAVHQYSKGYPRLINNICDNTLLLGYVQEKKKLTPEMVRESYMDMKLPISPAEGRGMNNSPTCITREATDRFLSGATLGTDYSTGPEAATSNASRGKPHKKKPDGKKRFFKVTLLILFLFALALPILFPQETYLYFKTALTYCQNLLNGPDVVTMPKESRDGVSTLSHPNQPESTLPTELSLLKDPGLLLQDDNTTELPEDSKTPDEQRHLQQPIRVMQGDTLMVLALRVYDIGNDKILQLLKTSNPRINDPNIIETGQKIVFPPLTDKEISGRYSVHIASFPTVYASILAYSRFRKNGNKVHILLSRGNEDPIFKVALGTLATVQEAREYANDLLSKGGVDFANPIPLPMVGQ